MLPVDFAAADDNELVPLIAGCSPPLGLKSMVRDSGEDIRRAM